MAISASWVAGVTAPFLSAGRGSSTDHAFRYRCGGAGEAGGTKCRGSIASGHKKRLIAPLVSVEINWD